MKSGIGRARGLLDPHAQNQDWETKRRWRRRPMGFPREVKSGLPERSGGFPREYEELVEKMKNNTAPRQKQSTRIL